MNKLKKCKTTEERIEIVKEKFLSIGCKVNEEYIYSNAKDKVPFTIIDEMNEFYGLRGTLIWNNVSSGQKFDIKCLIPEDRDKFIKKKFNDIGLEPLEQYKRNTDPILVKIIDKDSRYFGFIGKISPLNVREGQGWDSRTLLRSEWERYVAVFCEKIDYKVIKFPKAINNKITVKTRKGNIWSVVLNDLYNGVRCPLDTSTSFGERCLNEILKLNKINFEYQKTITYEDGARQYMDFYLPDYNLCIEYHGEQHYKEYGSNFGQDFNDRVRLDDKKKSYCLDNKIKYTEIHYTINTLEKIGSYLSNILNVYLKLPSELDVQYSELYNDEEIIESYKNLKSIQKVAKLYSLSSTPVHNVLKRHGIKVFGNKKKVIQLSLTGEFIREWESESAAKKNFNTTANIRNACLGILKTSCGFKWMYKDDYVRLIENNRTQGVDVY